MSSNLYKIATCTVFDWFSQNLAHMICLSIRKKNCGTYFRNLDFENFGLSLSNSSSGFIWTDRPPLVVCFHIFFNYSQLFALRSVYCVFSVFWGNILLIASEVLAIISGVWHQTQLTHLVTHWLMSLMFQWTTTPILTWYSEPLYLHASALPVSAVLQRDALWACLAKRCFCNTLSERT